MVDKGAAEDLRREAVGGSGLKTAQDTVPAHGIIIKKFCLASCKEVPNDSVNGQNHLSMSVPVKRPFMQVIAKRSLLRAIF